MSRVNDVIALRRLPGAITRDESGIAVVEFAFIAVFMIFLYLGSVQLADAIFANRKVTTTARAVTDLTTQYSVMAEQDIDRILSASSTLLAPYSAENAQIRISQIAVDDEGNASVSWSRTTPDEFERLTTGEKVDLPDDLVIPNTFLIYGEVNYTHRPIVAAYSVGTLQLSDQIFMVPRVSSSVSLLTAQ